MKFRGVVCSRKKRRPRVIQLSHDGRRRSVLAIGTQTRSGSAARRRRVTLLNEKKKLTKTELILIQRNLIRIKAPRKER